ncbi:beta-glucoside-specific PTS transporter subunit IIABC [Bacillus solitudinis]|uniref:beta-glucoside-specific PTS transporter subunit IIABC n=1 Tax=Bacillus solitudinis TaxID=2014074 RepID=UPI000C24401B|nr:beta-glucoside-specific PTS transporter subunit IIABC [Bacillus solitudinis]
MDYNETAREILRNVGGQENVQQAIHCMTRLRFNLNDNTKVNRTELENVPGVMGTNISGSQFQVIIGNEVPKVYNAIMENSNLGAGGTKNNGAPKEKEGIISTIFDVISGTFTPILPAIAGAGMIKGILAIVTTFGWLSPESQTYIILNAIGDGAFFFLPILLAFSAAKKFGSNPFIGAAIAAAILHPSITSLLGAAEQVHFLGLPVTAVTYSSTVIPILLGIWIASYVERLVDRITHSSIKLIVVPTLTLLIMVPIILITVGPLGFIIGEWLSVGVETLFNVAGFLASALLGGTWSLIIMTGMHYAFLPIVFNNIATNGYDYLITTMFAANMGQAGAALAVGLKSKDKQFRALATTTSLTALMGITEPAMYGVNMRLKKPFIAALIGGAAGGLWMGIFNVKYYILGGNVGLPGVASLIGPTFLQGIIGMVISFVVALIVGLLLGFKDVTKATTEPLAQDKVNIVERVNEGEPNGDATVKAEDIMSPLNGEIKDLSEVNDPTFSKRMMGNGIAIIPNDGVVVSPVEGTVTALFPTNHAIGITSKNGAEILVHVGLETVNLNGKYFDSHINLGDSVQPGDKLITFDVNGIKSEGYDLITPVIISNTDRYESISPACDNNIHKGDILLQLK